MHTTPGNYAPASSGWATWIAFAGLMMIMIGIFDVIGGLAGLFSDNYFVVNDSQLMVFDFTAWGIIWLAIGALVIAAGWGLISGASWARWFAIVLAFFNCAGQIAFLSAQPIWSLLMIALNVLIIFALTVRWDAARRAME